jgi:hypothetical protein
MFDHLGTSLSLSKKVDTYGHSYLNWVSHYNVTRGWLES